MSEINDLVMPVLQRIQKEMGDMRRSLSSKIDDVAEKVISQGEKLDAIEGYLTYQMGVTLQHKSAWPRCMTISPT